MYLQNPGPPVDGSEALVRCSERSGAAGQGTGGELRLLHIVKAIDVDDEFSADDSSRRISRRDSSKIGKSILANANATVREQGLAPECLLIESVAGSAAAVICSGPAMARGLDRDGKPSARGSEGRRQRYRGSAQRLADPGAVGARDCGAGGTSGAQPGGASRIGLRVGSPAHRRSVALSLEEQLVKPLGLVVGQALQQ